MAEEQGRRGIAFYLFGVRRTTGILMVVLLAVVFAPMFIGIVTDRYGPPPEPRRYTLDPVRESRSWIRWDGRWAWVEDFDGDLEVDCFRIAGWSTRGRWAPEHEGRCRSRALGVLLRLGDARAFDGDERDVLSRLHRYKFEQSSTLASTEDVDGDGRVDCVYGRDGGPVLRRSGVRCPGEEYALPDPLEGDRHEARFQRIYELEAEARQTLAALR